MPVLKLSRTNLGLTKDKISSKEPGEYRDSDLKGFLLLIGPPSTKNPQGVQTWSFDYWNAAGLHRRVALGHMPGLSPDGARTLALAVAAEVAAGVDVYATR